MKRKTQMLALAICVVMLMMAAVAMSTMADTASDNTASNEGALWESGVSAPRALTYPPLPPGTYDIVYDTEPEASWGPILSSSYLQHLRVRFTPTADCQLVREARIAWAGPWGGNNQFEIHIVDVDTGNTEITPVITEPDPNDWKVYDVSDLGFYTSGDFYIEFWAVDCDIGVYVDDTEPIYSRSEVNRGDGWYYPSGWVPSDFKIRAVLNLEYCVIETAAYGTPLPEDTIDALILDPLRELRDGYLKEEHVDRYYDYSPELTMVITKDPTLAYEAARLLVKYSPMIQQHVTGTGKIKLITGRDVAEVVSFTDGLKSGVMKNSGEIGATRSQEIIKYLDEFKEQVEASEGKTFSEALQSSIYFEYYLY